MPRFPRKVRQDKSQPVEKPRQDRAEQVETPNADTAPPPEESEDSLAFDEEQPLEEEPQLAELPDQARADEEATEPMAELVEESPEEREQLAFYESLPALLTSSELGEVLCVNRSTVYSWRLVGYLPEPIRVLPQIGAVWLTTEIRAWLGSRQWADNERARTVYKLFKEHGEDLNEWISPKSDTEDYLPATVPTGIVGEQQPIRNEQLDAALDNIEEAFQDLERLRGTKYEVEALALIANRLSHITKTATPSGLS